MTGGVVIFMYARSVGYFTIFLPFRIYTPLTAGAVSLRPDRS